MKRLLLVFTFIVFVLSACAGHVNYIRENPDRLSPGLKAKAFLKAWGEPDEQLSYHNFLNKYGSNVSNQVGSRAGTGTGSEYGQRSHYTHETLVWIYQKQQKILFFEKGYLVYDAPGSLELVWRLVGWENLTESAQSGQQIKSFESPARDHQQETTYKITYDDGSKYLGGMLDGRRHGQGTYTWPSGDKYVGEWINNRAIGGWFYKTTGRKLWVYQDSAGNWIIN